MVEDICFVVTAYFVTAVLLIGGHCLGFPDFCGETPLHKAARNGNTECISLLLESSCDARSVNNVGESASTLAEKHQHFSLSTYIHQAELVQALSATNGNSTYNDNFSNVSDFNLNEERFSRKRRFGGTNANFAKRVRTHGPEVTTPLTNMQENTNCCQAGDTNSVVEHKKLCMVEQGYVCNMLHMMLNDVHGC